MGWIAAAKCDRIFIQRSVNVYKAHVISVATECYMPVSRKGYFVRLMSYRGELPGRRRRGAVTSPALKKLKQLVDQDGYTDLYRKHINMIREGHLTREYLRSTQPKKNKIK